MSQTRFGSGSDADPGQTYGKATVSLPDPPVLTPDLIKRFKALIEEVTQELMQGPCNDRNTCRADAIALLVAASERFENPAEGIESPLK